MIMQANSGDGGSRPRRPSGSHPWRKHQTPRGDERPPLNHKACMAVSEDELRAVRARAGALSVSEFLRRHFPAELLTMPEGLAG